MTAAAISSATGRRRTREVPSFTPSFVDVSTYTLNAKTASMVAARICRFPGFPHASPNLSLFRHRHDTIITQDGSIRYVYVVYVWKKLFIERIGVDLPPPITPTGTVFY